ncbi:hypothetical protein M9Y10_009620 [Tritrichomonas musculus]|uniref:Sulfatase N-terminal domain-containing protein n=1 Tax=Tritrichomonas musculus TaxID=1915356 RepID=A0ABR2INV7_9EUKA
MWKSSSPFFTNRFTDSEVPITFNILHILLIVILEHVQNSFGQKFNKSLIDIAFFTVLLTIFHNFSFYPIFSFFTFVYEVIETLSWSIINSGITFQVLSALEFIYALNAMPDNVMRIFYWSILLFGFCNIQFVRINFRYTHYEFYIFVMLLLVLFYPFAVDKYSNLYPFRINGLMSKKVFDKIVLSFTSKKQSNFESTNHKNLIMIEIESFETKCMGRFNKLYPKSMPFLSNLSDSILHFSKIPSQPYTTWSAAGMFVVHCGFPLIVNNVDWSVRGSENFELWKSLPCISDYLNQLGYNQKAFCTGSCDIMNMKGFIVDHHYQTYDMEEHGIDRDSVLFNHIETDVLPDLIKTSQNDKKPFSLFILTADTHPEFWVDDKFCSDLTDENFKSPTENGENGNDNQNAGVDKNYDGDDDEDEMMNKKKKKIENEKESDESDKNKEKSKKESDESDEKKKKTEKDESDEKKKKTEKDESDEKKKKTEKDESDEKKKKNESESDEKKKKSEDDDENGKSSKKREDKKKSENADSESDKEKKTSEKESDKSDSKKKKKESEDDKSGQKKSDGEETDKKKNEQESDKSDKKKKKKIKSEDNESDQKKKEIENDKAEKKKKNESKDDETEKKKNESKDDETEKKKNESKGDETEKITSDSESDEPEQTTKNEFQGMINNDDQIFGINKFIDGNNNNFDGNNINFDQDRSKEPMPKLFRCFTCFDRIFKKFYNKLQSLGLNASNTVFAVYGDHLTMGERTYYYGEDRTLSLIFPFITKSYLKQNLGVTKKAAEKKKITFYDVAPTILDLLNIHYSPPFPWGHSAFSADESDPPSVDDFKFIYNYLTGDIKYEKVRCLNSEGFCTGNEY